ncbi:MAG: hypothetical protein AAF591_14940, partial [Verrucomicrobiota bacterium]
MAKKLLITIFAAVMLPCAAASAVVFEEDFTSGTSAIEKWPMKDRSFWRVTDEGRLASAAPEGTNIVGCSSPRFAAGRDLTFTFDFNLQQGREINFKVNYSEGGHIFRFVVNSHGFLLRINTNRNIPIEEPVNMEALQGRVAPDQWHTMTIVMKGDTVTGSIPGVGEKTYESPYFDNPIS